MERQKLTVEQFRQLIIAGTILPGDCMIYRSGHPGLVGWTIPHVQKRLLRDLLETADADFTKEQLQAMDEAAAYSHVGAVVDATCDAGMLPKTAQTRKWEVALPAGTQIVVRRPRFRYQYDTEPARGNRIKQHALADVDRKLPYPTCELVGYWLWSWGLFKLIMRRPFSKVFSTYHSDVCSGRYWIWMQRSNAIGEVRSQNDHLPEAWYPARLLIDADHLVDIAKIEIIAE